MTGPNPSGPSSPDARLLVALDIDGTLLSYTGELSPAVRDAVVGVRAAGHEVVLATGRSVHATLLVTRELGIDRGWAVASNGSVTVRLDPDLPDGWELDEVVTFDPEPALRVMHREMPDAHFAVEEIGVGYRLNKPFPDGELHGRQEVQDIEALVAEHVTRLVVRSPGHTSEEFHDLVRRAGLADVTYAIGWTAWMDVAPEGVTKARALERLRTTLGFTPAATVAVGDGNNDVDMLRWAARGVAMGHAAPEVQAAAVEVTGTVGEDGAAAVLRSLV